VVEGLIHLPRNRDAQGKVVNIGTQEETTILNLAERVRDLTESESEIRFIPFEEAYGEGFDDMRRRVPDLTRVRDLIGWQAKYSLEEIILQVSDYFRSTGLKDDYS
jgi:UDP-glucose 4-epimerase